jgi:hypothetical protein
MPICSDAEVFVMSRIASEESDNDDPIDETDDTTRSGGCCVLVEACGNVIAANKGGLDSLVSFERTCFIWRWKGPDPQTKIWKRAEGADLDHVGCAVVGMTLGRSAFTSVLIQHTIRNTIRVNVLKIRDSNPEVSQGSRAPCWLHIKRSSVSFLACSRRT